MVYYLMWAISGSDLGQRYCSEKFNNHATMGSGNLDVVNFTAETILQWTIGKRNMSRCINVEVI